MLKQLSRTVTLVTLSLSLGACAAAAGSGGTQHDLITREEIDAAGVSNLYDVVQRLRPRWLTVRGGQSFGLESGIVVYQNQTMLGGVDALRQLSPDIATSLRYMDGITASASLPGLGSRHVEGAIIVNTQRR